MTVDAEILRTIAKMPEPLTKEVLHYARYLIANYIEEASQESLLPQKRRSGILQGTFALPLLDDFDELIADFKEYME